MKEETYFSTIAFYFFPTYRVFKKLVQIRLVVTTNLNKIRRPEAEILAHEVETMEKVAVDQHARGCSRAQSSSHACETTGVLSGSILFEKRFFLSIILRATRKLTKIDWLEFSIHFCINVLQDLSKYAPLQCSLMHACQLWRVQIAHACSKKSYPASLKCI